jgi:hypothetical protein
LAAQHNWRAQCTLSKFCHCSRGYHNRFSTLVYTAASGDFFRKPGFASLALK